MSSWSKVESKYGREVNNISRIVEKYGYDEKHASETDKKIRSLLIFKLRGTKSILTDLMIVAHKETDDSATELKRVRDDLDLAITEIQSLNYWKFPDKEELLEKILKADLVLLNNTDVMEKAAAAIQYQVVKSEKGDLLAKLETLRKMLSDSRAVFLERAEIIKIKR